jgi:hypothetical protein
MANQTEKDAARAKSKQNGGGGGTIKRMSRRGAASSLNLAGNDTTSGRSDTFYQFSDNLPSTDEPIDHGVHDQTDDRLPLSQEAFASIICVNGKPHYASIQGIIGDKIV